MKYLKFTYVDAITGIPITDAPATNGPKWPDIDGLEFVWARESRYPTSVPEFFGTCPDNGIVMVAGVLDVLAQADWETMRADEMAARAAIATPRSVTMRQARLAMLSDGILDDVEGAIAAIPDETQRKAAQIEWEYAQDVARDHWLLASLMPVIGLTDAQVDELFVLADTL